MLRPATLLSHPDATTTTGPATASRNGRWPIRGWIGLVAIAIAWALAWFGSGQARWHTFFPLWLGYILTIDALLWWRRGSSPWSRSRTGFGSLFLTSIPLWWIFEGFNARLHNWNYQLPEPYSWLHYHLEATLAFSTVVPALAVTAELYAGSGWLQRRGAGPVFAPGPHGRAAIALAGLAMAIGVLVWPRFLFPLTWLGCFLVFDPIARALGGDALSADVARGDWRRTIAWMAAGLTCGLLWEMWNVRAMPKWVYDVPFVDTVHLFEMPLPGYGGYLPFGLEVFAWVGLMEALWLKLRGRFRS